MIKLLRRAAQFSTKSTQRLQRKVEEEKQAKSAPTLESVVDQQDYTPDEVYALIEKRKEFVKKLSEQTNIPKQAYLVALATLGPLAILSGSTLAACYYPPLMPYVGNLYHATIKYAALNLCFQSGIHWGFAMSMHECQLDSISSSPEARWHFLYATVPIIATILILQHFLYGDHEKMKAIGGVCAFMAMNVAIFALDAKAKKVSPGWFIKMKGGYSIAFQLCILPCVYVTMTQSDKIIAKPHPYRIL